MFNESTKLDRILSQCIQAIEVKGWTVEQCLEQYPRDRDELEPMLWTAMRLRKVRTIRPSIEFRSKAQQRFRLRLNASRRSPWLSKSESQAKSRAALEEKASLFQGFGSLQWAAPLLLIMIILIGTGGGIAFAADNAKPGDFLYAIDTGIEDIRIKFAVDLQSIVRLRFQFADERLEEATQLAQAGETQSIALVIQGYKEQIAAATPLIIEAHLAGENVQPLIKETNEAIYLQQKKLEDLMETVPTDVEDVIKLALKDIKEIRFLVAAPLPTLPPIVVPSPTFSFYPSPTYLSPPPTSPPEPLPTSWPTSTGTFIPGPSPTVGAQIPTETPTPPTSASGTPTATTNPYVTTTPTGTITITPTPSSTKTPWPTYTPTPIRTKTPIPTYTGTPTPTEDGPP